MCTCTSHVQVASLTRLRLRRPGEGGGLALRQGGQRPAAGEVVQACSWALLLSAWAFPRAWVKESESRRPGVRWRPVLPPQETGGESPALLPCHFGGGRVGGVPGGKPGWPLLPSLGRSSQEAELRPGAWRARPRLSFPELRADLCWVSVGVGGVDVGGVAGGAGPPAPRSGCPRPGSWRAERLWLCSQMPLQPCSRWTWPG